MASAIGFRQKGSNLRENLHDHGQLWPPISPPSAPHQPSSSSARCELPSRIIRDRVRRPFGRPGLRTRHNQHITRTQ